MRHATLVLVAALVIVPGAAGMDGSHGGTTDVHVHVDFAAFSPAEVDVVTGESVRWTNDSVRAHDVAAEDGRFDSGRLERDATFTHRFEAPERVAYFCRLHPSMRGTVVVSTLLLDAPVGAAGPRRPFALRGRTGLAAGTRVTVTAQVGEAPARPVATTSVEPDGRFAAEVVPTTTSTYRATAADATSPPVTLLVLDRRVTGTVRRTARLARVRARVTPAIPGGTVVLQARSAEHFGWYPLLKRRLDGASSVRFALPLRRRLPLRVVLTLPDGATVLASSGPLGAG